MIFFYIDNTNSKFHYFVAHYIHVMICSIVSAVAALRHPTQRFLVIGVTWHGSILVRRGSREIFS